MSHSYKSIISIQQHYHWTEVDDIFPDFSYQSNDPVFFLNKLCAEEEDLRSIGLPYKNVIPTFQKSLKLSFCLAINSKCILEIFIVGQETKICIHILYSLMK